MELIPAISFDASRAESLCLHCGLCCDGTLFERARLSAEDEPARLAAGSFILLTTAKGPRFALPCHHHQHRACSIYHGWRPKICHSFRCTLLRRFDAGELTEDDAHAVIERTVEHAARVWSQLRVWTGETHGTLRQMFQVWAKSQVDAGIDVHRAHTPFMLEYAALQRRLDRDFRPSSNPASSNGEHFETGSDQVPRSES